jgi:hypothetical protein
LNIFWLWVDYGKSSPEYNSLSHNWVEKRLMNHYQWWMRHVLMHLSTQNAVLNLFISKSYGFSKIIYDQQLNQEILYKKHNISWFMQLKAFSISQKISPTVNLLFIAFKITFVNF